MMLALYRYLPTLPAGSPPPVIPFLSVSYVYEVHSLPTASMEGAERLWNETQDAVASYEYQGQDYYYFIVLADTYLPLHPTYRLLSMENPTYWLPDSFVVPLMTRFVQRLMQRLATRTILRRIDATLPQKDTVLYHQRRLEALEANPWSTPFHPILPYDFHLIQRIKAESKEIVEAHEQYQPKGERYDAVQREFESLQTKTSL